MRPFGDVTFLLVGIAAALKVIQSSVVVEVRLLSFENDEGLAVRNQSNAGCCDDVLGQQGNCSAKDSCDTYFEVCAGLPGNFTGCSLQVHTNVTDVFNDTNSLNFTTNSLSQDVTFNFTFDTWMGAVYLDIDAKDRDPQSVEDDVIGDFEDVLPLDINASDPHILQMTVNQSSLTVEVRAMCSANYYGENCTVYCAPQDSKLGHYTCSSLGAKICLPGIGGADCQTPTSPCVPQPCQNGGSCISRAGLNIYACLCPPLFTGKQCEIALYSSPSGSSRTATPGIVISQGLITRGVTTRTVPLSVFAGTSTPSTSSSVETTASSTVSSVGKTTSSRIASVVTMASSTVASVGKTTSSRIGSVGTTTSSRIAPVGTMASNTATSIRPASSTAFTSTGHTPFQSTQNVTVTLEVNKNLFLILGVTLGGMLLLAVMVLLVICCCCACCCCGDTSHRAKRTKVVPIQPKGGNEV